MDIGQRIRIARKQKGYTQGQLGELIGVQKSAVAKYERGAIVNIKRSTLQKLSQVLELPAAELVSEIETNPVATANKIAEIALDRKLMRMIEDYQSLDKKKQEQVREYVSLLAGK